MKRARNANRKNAAAQSVTTVTVLIVAPRNPFVAHAHRRKAGAHGGSARTRRQHEKRELKKLLDE